MNNTEDIRKKEKKLSRDHWMCRIQKYAFDIDAPSYYMGYCPFFWMTWVAVVLFPIIYVGRVCAKHLVKFNDYLDSKSKPIRNAITKSADPFRPLQPTHEELCLIADYLDEFEQYRDNEKCGGSLFAFLSIYVDVRSYTYKCSRRISRWFDENPNWQETHLPIAREYEKKLAAERKLAEEREKQKALRRRKVSNYTSICGKFLFKIIIPILIGALAFIVYKLLALAYATITLFAVLTLLLGLILAGIGYYLTLIICDFLKSFVLTDKTADTFCGVMGRITDSLGCIGNMIKSVYAFIVDTVKLTYKAECPMIIWGEETGKITRREKEM